MTEMFGEAWSPMSVPDLAPDDDDTIKKSPTSFPPGNRFYITPTKYKYARNEPLS